MKSANLIDKLFSRLPEGHHLALGTLISLAQESGSPLYLVGGAVRDLLLEAATIDLDLSIEGDAATLAHRLATELGLRSIEHRAFLTAVVRDHGFSLDLATARRESYLHPGALPKVRPASIHEDMLRRDFTINAMALALTGPHRGDLLDPCGGRADLAQGLVRVLHEKSFVDDPTRILRAARYEARFGFRLEERTQGWLLRDVAHLDIVSGVRIRQELDRILEEERPETALLRLQELGALAPIHPAFSFDQQRAQAFAGLRELAPEAVPSAYWPLLGWGLDQGRAAALAARLALPRPQAEALRALPLLAALQEELSAPALRPSAIAAMLSPYPAAALWALAAATASPTVTERCLAYLRHGRYARCSLDGHALLALGVPPGPKVGEVLQRLKAAKLDGVVSSHTEEEQFVRSLLAKEGS